MVEGDQSRKDAPLAVIVCDGGEEKKHRFFGNASLRIGRAQECDIVLKTKRASRHHATIEAVGEDVFIVDAESSNGTFHNGVRITRQVLSLGDVIHIGDARIIFGESTPLAASEPTAGAEPADLDAASRPVQKRPAKRRSSRRWARTLVGSYTSLVWVAAFVALGWLVWEEFSDPLVDQLLDRDRSETPADSRGPEEGVRHSTVSERPTPSTSAEDGDGVVVSSEWDGTEAIREVENSEDEERSEVSLREDEPEQFRAFLRDVEHANLGWQTIELLRQRIELGTTARDSEFYRRLLDILQKVRNGVEIQELASAQREVGELVKGQRYSEAALIAHFFSTNASTEAQRKWWREESARIEAEARETFRAVEAVLSERMEAGKPVEALETLLGVRAEYGGIEFFESLVPRHLESARSLKRTKAAEPLSTPKALRLKDQVATLMEECRFQEVAFLYHELLALEPGVEERVEFLNGILKATYMDRTFQQFLAAISEETVEVNLDEAYSGRVLSADQEEVEFELDIDGRRGSYRDKRRWDRVPFLKKFELFKSVRLSREALLGVIFYAFHHGYEEGAHEVLLRLRKRKNSAGLADAVLALHRGIAVPEGGFVEYRDRLVTSEYRTADIARRKRIREEEEAARAELRRIKKETFLTAYVQMALKNREKGFFSFAQSILEAIARRFASTEAGQEAMRLTRDSFLFERTLLESGPSKNRLDFYFMAEGYPIDDDYQAAFLVNANVAMNLLLKDDPYKEYRSYLNFYAVQLKSRDRGVDRSPGNVLRDTALDGGVEWDRFTVNRAKVRAVLQRVGEGGLDGQALVIGNDYAGVSTGGGGVSCLSKVSLDAIGHEIGHSLTGLHDEYDYEPGTNPERHIDRQRSEDVPVAEMPPNLMRGSDRDGVLADALWRDWIEAGEEKWWNGQGVSAFEGGNRRRFNFWRPQATCKMRTSASRFCVVCMEAMVKRIYDFVRPIDRVEPEHSEITVEEGKSVDVRVWVMKPETHFLEATWKLERLADKADDPTVVVGPLREVPLERVWRRFDAEGRVVEVAVLRYEDFEKGRYRLQLTVRDPTPWVLTDRQGRLSQTRAWTVVFAPSSRED